MKKILVVDDELEMLNSLEKILNHRNDFDVEIFQDGKAALNELKEKSYDLIITDLKMKDISGLDILKAATEYSPGIISIVISGYGTIEASVEAMREGAYDFIEKPFTSKRLFECIDRAFKEQADLNKKTGTEKYPEPELAGIVYKSRQMQEIIEFVKKISPQNMNVLITGESGTGKELIARAIHNLSKGNLNPFVPVNCGALPETLFESELFGHEKGAFTGAIKTKPGLLEFANDGTFFFDEIGEMSLALQIKLLRMLEERKIRRVGGQQEININVRIIAATNQDLEKSVQEGKFREDLYYRLNTIKIEIPPLRKRREDILPLVNYYMKDFCTRDDKEIRRFTKEAEDALVSYDWPGNVREVQNIIGRAYYLCSTSIIQKNDLPLPLLDKKRIMDDDLLKLSFKDAKENLIEQFETDYLTYYLKKNQGNISKTADECGLDRRSIHRLINKYNILYQDNEG